MRYISADEVADTRTAWRCGLPLNVIAGHLNISVSLLRRILDLRPLVAGTTTVEPDPEPTDVWRSDYLFDNCGGES